VAILLSPEVTEGDPLFCQAALLLIFATEVSEYIGLVPFKREPLENLPGGRKCHCCFVPYGRRAGIFGSCATASKHLIFAIRTFVNWVRTR